MALQYSVTVRNAQLDAAAGVIVITPAPAPLAATVVTDSLDVHWEVTPDITANVAYGTG